MSLGMLKISKDVAIAGAIFQPLSLRLPFIEYIPITNSENMNEFIIAQILNLFIRLIRAYSIGVREDQEKYLLITHFM
ncbi:hypothetical protein C3388_03425 [Leclercia sp. LSNIH5]|nr:hypothetical protein C3388_03425 [Leclercia sp. LSNIH5]POW68714.1 hypothetical protein C3389_03020 [Leclercia sp. LSNIH2]